MKYYGCPGSSDADRPISIAGMAANSTGLKTGGVFSIGAGGAGVATTFTIASGVGMVVDNTTTPATLIDVSWAAQTNVAVTNIATQPLTFVAINSSGAIIQQAADFSGTDHRQYIVIGTVVHTNLTTVTAVNQAQHLAISPQSQLNDLLQSLAGFNISGNLFSANGANLNINKTVGEIFKQGANYATSANNPNIVATASLTAASFRYNNQTGAASASLTSIDPGNYDLAGVTTAVPVNKFTVQRIFLFSSNLLAVQRGQSLYNSLAEATAAIQTESFVVNPSIVPNGILRAFLVVRQGTTALNSATGAFFLEAPKFGGTSGVGGLSVSTLQNAYDNSSSPEILTDATRGAVDFRRGSAADTDDVIVVQNNAGTVKFSVTGNGVTTAPTVYGSSAASGDLTLGSTSNATKGRVLIGSSIYDEVNNKLGVGVGAGNFKAALDIVSLGNSTSCLRFQDKTLRIPLLDLTQGGVGNCNFFLYNISGNAQVLLGASAPSFIQPGVTIGDIRKSSSSSAGAIFDTVGAGGINCINTTGITLASESLTNGALTSGTSWTSSGADVALTADTAVFTYSTGAASFINQTNAAMAVALKANTYYAVTLTITGATANSEGYVSAVINDGVNQSQFLAFNRSLVIYFKAGTGPTQFRISATLTSGQAFTIDNISCKEVTSGGLYTGGGNKGLNVAPDGRLYGTGLHNSTGAVTGATNQYIASGTYTPTLTNVTNVAASTARLCTWTRIGNVVAVSGQLDIDLTTTLLASEVDMSLPIASAFTTAYQLGGSAAAVAFQANWAIQADAANDRAQLMSTGIADVGNNTYTFNFGYEVL